MKKAAEKAMILRLEHLIDEELSLIEETTSDKTERLEKADVLYNMFKYLSNYEELKPVLQKFFSEKAKKEKWER